MMEATRIPILVAVATTTQAVDTASTTGLCYKMGYMFSGEVLLQWKERHPGVRRSAVQHDLQLQPGHLLHQEQVGD